MFSKRHLVTCDIPYSDLFLPLLVCLAIILFLYSIMIMTILIMCRKNRVILENIQHEVDRANAMSAITIRNIANERFLDNTRFVRVMGSLVDVLKK